MKLCTYTYIMEIRNPSHSNMAYVLLNTLISIPLYGY